MFEKYNIKDLFLAEILVNYPDPVCESDWECNAGGMLLIGPSGYGYWSIVKKEGDHYIDLKSKKIIKNERDSRLLSYTIGYIEPLEDYYTQEGKKKEIFSKESEKHYEKIHQKHWELTKSK